MKIYVSGVSYRNSPIEIREKLSFSNEQLKILVRRLKSIEGLTECIALSTCNRTEVYVFSNEESFDPSIIEKEMCEQKGLNIYNFKKNFYFYNSKKAVKHLYKVACGLDSMVLGEDQILGQVKAAYEIAVKLKSSGSVLNKLFLGAITTAKKIKTETLISQNSISVSTLAVKLVKETFGDEINNKSVLIIGTGKMGGIALKNFLDLNLNKIYITNRTQGKCVELQKKYCDIESIDYKNRFELIEECDIVISATSSPHYTITQDVLEKVIKTYKKRILIDLAIPRDIDQEVKKIKGINYFNIDDLKNVADENLYKRINEAEKAKEMLEAAILDYERWYEFRNHLPVLRDIQQFADQLIEKKTGEVLTKVKNISDEEKTFISQGINSSVNEVISRLVYSIRDDGSRQNIRDYFSTLEEVLCTKEDTSI